IAKDARELTDERPFDAVVGRLVLMYFAEPGAVLRKLAERARSGGLIVFHEFIATRAHSVPHGPLVERALGWVVGALKAAGANPDMGHALFPAFRQAGLPDPQLRLEARIGGGDNPEAAANLAGIVRTLLPVLERAGLATALEVGTDTLADRIRDEVTRSGAVVVAPPFIGAWVRKP